MDEAHAHNAAAYVELNPVRAGLVEHAWEYGWSSAGAHCGKAGDSSGMPALSEWCSQMPGREWEATLETIAGADDAVERLRMHTRTGRPLGDDAFLSRVEAVLGRRVRPMPIGRPKGWRKK